MSWLRGHPVAVLLGLGVASQLIYALFVFLFPLVIHGSAPRPFDMQQIAGDRRWMGWSWVAGVLVLYTLFGLGLWVLSGKDTSLPGKGLPVRKLILFFSLVFSVTLVWLYPVTATDLFQYVMRARVWVVHGANPMAVSPEHFPLDPLLPFVGEWAGIVSPYGPAWELLAAGIAGLGLTGAVSGGLGYKTLALVSYWLIIGLLLWGGGSRRKPGLSDRALLFFAWNPLVLIQAVGNGHNDILMMMWMLLGLVIWQRQPWKGWLPSWGVAWAAMCLAVLTKASAVVMASLLLAAVLRAQPGWRRRVMALVGMAVVGVGLALVVYVPFWPPWGSIAGVLDEMSHRYTYSIAATLRMMLSDILSPQTAWNAPRTTGQLLFAATWGWCLVRLWQRRLDLGSAGFLAYFAYLVTSASYRIWYPLWLVPLVALSFTPAAAWRAFLLSLTSELSLAVFYFGWRWYWKGISWLQWHLRVVPWQFGIPLLLPPLLRRNRPVPGQGSERGNAI